MNIRLNVTGQENFQQPQQEWRKNPFVDAMSMQVANFAGQEMMIAKNHNGTFDLHYLGFTEGPHPTMDAAKEAAAKFALAVLDVMKSKISS